jgi:4,5-DOPA dioxygenase extradiol
MFVSFGSPLAIRHDEFARALKRFGVHLRAPRGILVASAHWRGVRPLRLTASPRPPALHDYGDFPQWLQKLTYECPGLPSLASDAAARLRAAGIPALLDHKQGLDYSVWMPLSLLFASAQVPVVQLSLPAGASPDEMIAIGKVLAPLRRAGYLIMGSGCTAYNPHRARYDQLDALPESWARSFDTWIGDRLASLDIARLTDYRRLAPHVHLSAPTSAHLDPLFFVLGTVFEGDAVHNIYEGFHAASLSLRTLVIAGRRKDDWRLPDQIAGR